MMHIYAFGSICRGDISVESDIDLLAIVDGQDSRLAPEKFSIYSYSRIRQLWLAGNAFAWHLSLESRMIYASDGRDFLQQLGFPSEYLGVKNDCRKFKDIFEHSFQAIKNGSPSLVFELSTIFLSLRNLATCYSLIVNDKPTFGRDSARRLGSRSLKIDEDIYSLLMRSRILSTRAVGSNIENVEFDRLIVELKKCQAWIDGICQEVDIYE